MTNDFTKLFQQLMEQGQEMAKSVNPDLASFKMPGMGDFMPTMPKDMMEMWMGKTFNPEGLDARTRLLVTLAALTVLGAQAEDQITLTVRHALEAGATPQEVAEVIAMMSMFGGVPAMTKAMELAQAEIQKTKGEGA
ncbi:carboxymuconolactone decarboxylase family protein [Vannielia litorea]|uniref:carboxymuconolactone decarboxylase family protein n=1 Tax=Vannielia litorea TaxID=1217970 RepID=UPI001BCB125C|nr:carboxymuconolactone decarboxylase family protein [Vannielia litorea]MBS8226524.1 carboxymuconolactone decarboxylase family protein [Vannielia litorea]